MLRVTVDSPLPFALEERQMGIYQGLSEYKPDAQASASILAYTRLRFGLVLVRNYLPFALMRYLQSHDEVRDAARTSDQSI